jgi:hypothetical protein
MITWGFTPSVGLEDSHSRASSDAPLRASRDIVFLELQCRANDKADAHAQMDLRAASSDLHERDDGATLHILVAGAGDTRHVLQTVARHRR